MNENETIIESEDKLTRVTRIKSLLKRHRKAILISCAGVVAVAGLITAGILACQGRHTKSTVAKTTATPAPTKTVVATATPTATSSVAATVTPTATPESTNFVLNIKELGISMTLPNSLKDITYKATPAGSTAYSNSVTRATFSTQAITVADPACSVDGVAPPLGSLLRVSGQYPSSPNVENSGGTLVKQFDGFYIGVLYPQALCSSSSSSSAENLAKTARAGFASAFATIVSN
jgi:hypothetical protein